MPLKLIAGFSLLWYVVHELTPLKLFPDVSRYMLTLAPLLCILAMAFVYELFQRRDPRPVVAAVNVIAAAIPALCTSGCGSTARRKIRVPWSPILAATGARIATDRYAEYDASRTFLCEPQLRPNADTADIVVTANLGFDPYKNYAARKTTGWRSGLSRSQQRSKRLPRISKCD